MRAVWKPCRPVTSGARAVTSHTTISWVGAGAVAAVARAEVVQAAAVAVARTERAAAVLAAPARGQ